MRVLQKIRPYPIRWRRQKSQDQGGFQPNSTAFKNPQPVAGLLAAAVFFRPLSPFAHDLPTRLDGTPVLILDGEKDRRRAPGDGRRLAERLTRAGAAVTHHVLPVGHSITEADREIAKEWLAALS
jgi:predicted esterase